MWYIYYSEYYSVIKRNEIVPFAGIWMDLESVIQNEVSQKEKKKSPNIAYMCSLEKWYR